MLELERMPYLTLPNIDPRVFLGMWKVAEPEDYFRARLNIYENEQRILAGISHPQKRLEWLSSRLCLKELLQITHKVESLNAPTGQPYLSDHSFHISYSHSNMYSGAIASQHYPVSIDLEDLSKVRNLDTRFLFMHPDELDYFNSATDSRVFFLIWSAKETLYKIYTKRGIVFKENLLINPERKPLEQSGTVSGILKADGFEKTYTIYYSFFPGVLLTYTFDPGL
jgi:4'-phosphopantetheinyl transferase